MKARPLFAALALACLALSAAVAGALALSSSPADALEGQVRFYVFSSSNCPDCGFLDHELLPSLRKQYGSRLEYRYYDLAPEVSDIKAYKFMVNLEDSFGRTELDLPQVYIGNQALIGAQEVANRLPGLVAKYAERGGVPFPVLEINGAPVAPPATTPIKPPPDVPAGRPAAAAGPVYIAYFYRNACRECDGISVELDYLETYGGSVHVRKYDLGTKSGIQKNAAMGLAYGVPREKRGISPALFVGSHYLYGKAINRKSLNRAIDDERMTAPPNVPWEAARQYMDRARQELGSTFSGFNVLTVVGAGLVDGLNPCAFTVVIFLIAYLAYTGKTGRDALYVGIAMALTAFLTYLLLGVGLLSFVRAVSRSGTAGTWVTAVVASLTAVFGLLAIYDFLRSRKKGSASKALGMSGGMTRRIHKAIRDHTKTGYLVAGAAVLGVVVTVLEFGCTGQVYLPVITFVVRSGSDTVKAFLYLALFCAMSTVPLVVVFLLAYFGTSSRKLADFGRRHAPALTLLGGMAMLGLSVALFVTL